MGNIVSLVSVVSSNSYPNLNWGKEVKKWVCHVCLLMPK